MGLASADKGGVPDVLGTTRDLSCYFLFSIVPVDGSPVKERISIDYRQQFLKDRLYNSVSCFLRGLSLYLLSLTWVSRFDQSFGIYVSKICFQV